MPPARIATFRKSTIEINLEGAPARSKTRFRKASHAFGADGGHWRFYQQATDANAIEDSPSHGDPITAAEQQMFQKMYGDAGLDADTVKTVRDGWEKLTSAERKSQYDDFEEKIKQAVEAATPVEIRIVNPASNKASWSYLIDGKPTRLRPAQSRFCMRRQQLLQLLAATWAMLNTH